MLDRAKLRDEEVIDRLQEIFGLQADHLAFLPLGADHQAAAYRIAARDGREFFLKVTSGPFYENSVTMPYFLSERGIAHIIAPLPTNRGLLWASLGDLTLTLYPFVNGHDAYEIDLVDGLWPELGSALRQIHSLALPRAIASGLKRENYSSQGRDTVMSFLELSRSGRFDEPVSVELASFLQEKFDVIADLVTRTERLAQVVKVRAPQGVLCHNDLHAGNILIAGDDFYLVDWNDAILAPKERDLMYVGGGLIGRWREPEEEEALFYQGYGPTVVDPAAMAYYRYERIIQDMAVECRHVFLSSDSREARERSVGYLISNFEIGNVLEIAYNAEKQAKNRYP